MSARHQRLTTILALVVLLQTLLLVAVYLGEVRGGARFGSDFLSFWNAARHIADGRPDLVYDVESWRAVLQRRGFVTLSWFVYPPFALLALWPLGTMSYAAAVAWWSLLPIPLFLWLVALLTRNGVGSALGGRKMAAAALVTPLLCLPLLAANLFSGQTGAWMAVAWLAAAYWWERRPVASGAAIGLLAIKPQFGLLFPVALVAARRWRAIMAAAAVIVLLIVASVAAFGTGIWTDYVAMSGLFGEFVGRGRRDFSELALSPYVSLLAVGAPAAVALAIQAAAMLLSAAAVFLTFRRAGAATSNEDCPDLRMAALAVAAFLTTPYGLSYDSPALALVIVALVRRAWRTGWSLSAFLAVFAIAEVPFLNLQFARLDIPFGLISLIIAAIAIWHALERSAVKEMAPRA